MAKTIKFSPQWFQESFYLSTAAFPCRVGPWGDGKTLMIIMKGMALSRLYPGNNGLIIRKRYNALQRSTISDFTKWTELTVPEQKKSVVVKTTREDSVIHFAHCENIQEFKDGIQSMNLGWAAIEQGDELKDAAIFEELFGRIRRIITPRDDLLRKLISRRIVPRGTTNFEKLSKEVRNRAERYIIEDLGYPVRQLMVIANSCGHNWIYKRWNPLSKGHMTEADGYSYSEGKPFENVEWIPASTLRNWETLRKTAPKRYNRYVLNSHEDYDIEGSYFAELMSDALKEGRCERVNLYDKTELVFTFWDLGVRGEDSTSIWFVQFIGGQINLIDFYSNTGKGMDHYSQILNEKGYSYAEHWLPHDAAANIQGVIITTRLKILRNLRRGEDVHIVERCGISERHEETRSILEKCWFDERCEIGVEALNQYHKEINKAKSTEDELYFLDHPAKDKYSHPADAFGYMAVVYRNQSIDGVVLGATGPNPERYDDDGDAEIGTTDLLDVA